MRVDLLPIVGLPAAARAGWRDLADRASDPNPFDGCELATAASRHLCPDAHLLTAGTGTGSGGGGRFDAALPVRLVPRVRGVPLRAAASLDHAYCYLGTPLVDPDPARGGPALAAVLDALPGLPGNPRCAVFDQVGVDGRAGQALLGALRDAGRSAVPYRTVRRAVLGRGEVAPPTGAPPELAERAVALERDRRRLLRRLERATGGQVRLVDHGGGVPAVERFLALEAAGWKGRAGSAMACDPASAAFFRDACRALAATGRVHLVALSAGEVCVAMQWIVAAGTELFALKTAFDEEYGRFSPGLLMQLELRGWFARERRELRLDSCAAPDSAMFNRVFAGRRTLTTYLVPVGGPLTAGIVGALPAAAGFARRVRDGARLRAGARPVARARARARDHAGTRPGAGP